MEFSYIEHLLNVYNGSVQDSMHYFNEIFFLKDNYFNVTFMKTTKGAKKKNLSSID